MLDNITRMMLRAAMTQEDVYPKAIANFMFREIVEDAHTKYNISQDDMKAMCKAAVNRAAALLAIQSDPDMYKAFMIQALECREWDASELTDDLAEKMGMFSEWGKEI